MTCPVLLRIQSRILRDIFQEGKERPLKALIDYLLNSVLKSWHQHGQVVQEVDDLISFYRQWGKLTDEELPRLEVEKRVDALVQFNTYFGCDRN